MTRRKELSRAEASILRAGPPQPFSHIEVDGLPEPVQRHFMKAIAPEASMAVAARLEMRGQIKLGRRWLPFRATEVLAPHHGFVWSARVAGLIAGSDQYLHGAGEMKWKLAGLFTLAKGAGPDVSKSAAARGGAEALWLPTALLPRFGVRWLARDDRHVSAHYTVDDVPLVVHYELDDDARLASFVFDRWGDPDNSGTWTWHPFGGYATEYRTFDGLTIPAEGRVGWFFGTPGWTRGEFFRYAITDLRPLPQGSP
jgi:hypothetical protein